SRPVVVWVHGGGWVAGSPADVAPYAKIIAAEGHRVITIGYSLAPRHRYPTPVFQLDAALRWLADHAEETGCDTSRLVLAGDSAGAQVVVQYAAAVSDPTYAETLGLRPAIAPKQLRGVVAHCG